METQTAAQTVDIREAGLPIYQSKGWLKFLGVLSVIQGIMLALTLFGIVIAWLPIWVGVLLYQSAAAVETAHVTGNKEMLRRSLEKLKLYFTIQGIMTLIGIVVGAMAMTMGLLGAVIEALG